MCVLLSLPTKNAKGAVIAGNLHEWRQAPSLRNEPHSRLVNYAGRSGDPMTSSSSPCAQTVALRLTTGFQATIFCPGSASRIFPEPLGWWLHFRRTTLPRSSWSARMTTKIHSWMSTRSSTSSRARPSHRLPSGLSRRAARKRTASPRSRIANSWQTSSAEPGSCRELLNGAHAKLRAKAGPAGTIGTCRRRP